ncbi:AI-2E family transporter [Acidihalobacter ferrooxydans]|uniref:AI-2E family transporter n=1 Tax=Acidihalobacter ferrooxydans TaxID=1765967 RepID=A0A1P8UJE7_9GAMM|nr:AI-2E family transporter [Acidihalobacter ferrooxydans]APZ43924.1 AI-2E family transporter [Acidihalobacter ferrooxydans]
MRMGPLWFGLAIVVFLGWLIYLLSPILAPFLVGALLAYLGDPLADRLEAWHLPRTLAVVVVFVVMGVVVLGAVLLLVPLLEAQIAALAQAVPGYQKWVNLHMLPWLQSKLGISARYLDLNSLVGLLSKHWQQAGGYAAHLADTLSRSGLVLLGWLANLVLIPIVTFYLLRDWDRLIAYIGESLPARFQSTSAELAREADEVLGAFLRGQLSVMLALGTVYAVGLWLIGLKVGILIGVVAGVVSFVPYLGFTLGLIAALAAMFFQTHDVLAVWPVLVVFGIGQVLESAVFTPLLVGDRIGLHPVAVIFAVLAGGQLFGFIGVLLALPVAAVLAVFLRHLHRRYRGSAFYRDRQDDASA